VGILQFFVSGSGSQRRLLRICPKTCACTIFICWFLDKASPLCLNYTYINKKDKESQIKHKFILIVSSENV